MEAAGLAVGVLALAGLFNNAVDCFEYVRIGQALERDLDSYLLRLAAARLKLSRWGQAMGLNAIVDENSDAHVNYNLDEIQLARSLIEQIIQLFNDTAVASDKILKRSKSTHLAMVKPGTISESSSSQVRKILRDISSRRLSKVGIKAKAKWALHQKGQFSGLVDGVADLVNELVDLFPTTKQSFRRICSDEATELCGDGTITDQVIALQREATESDPELATAIASTLERLNISQQNTYYNNIQIGGTFNDQSRATGIQYGDSHFIDHINNVRASLAYRDMSERTPTDSVNLTGNYQNSNVFGHVENVHLSPGSLPGRAWTVPRAVNSLFTGREDIATMLEIAFARDWPVNKKPKTFVIFGLGGMGKSEVSIKYAFDHKEKYWGIFWVDCFDQATTKASFDLIGAACQIPEPTVDSVKAWLCSTDKAWLLIIDNADDPKHDYNEYLPSAGKGDIIITTRLPKCERYQNVGRRNLSQLEENSVRNLFFKAAEIDQESQAESTVMADKILDKLENHTLAVIHAGSFIRESCSLDDYVQLFESNRKRILLHRSGQEESTYKTVFATFEASAQKLEALRQSEEGGSISRVQAGDALDLLHTIAFMHNSGKFESIFAKARTMADDILSEADYAADNYIDDLTHYHASLLYDFFPGDKEDIERRIRWREACRALELFSFITKDDKSESAVFTIHRLVHIWAKERQDTRMQSRSWQAAASAVAFSCYKTRGDNLLHAVVREHAQKCAAGITSDFVESLPVIIRAQLLSRLAHINLDLREDIALQMIWNMLVNLKDAIFSADKDNEVAYRDLSGRIYTQFGRLASAEAEFEICIECAKASSRCEDDILALSQMLGKAYQDNGHAQKAVDVLERVVEARSMLSSDDTRRLDSERELAVAYRSNGQYEKATKLLEDIVEIRRTLASDDIGRLSSEHSLGVVYRLDGQNAKAIKMLEQVVEVRKKLPPNHSDRLTSQHELAGAYAAGGQTAKAVALLEYITEVRQQLDIRHPSRLSAQHELAGAYQENGQTDKAVELYKHVIELKSALEPSHPSLLVSQHSLAVAYVAAGRYHDAIDILQHVVEVERRTMQTTNFNRLLSEIQLGQAYVEVKEYRKAQNELVHVVQVQASILHEAHEQRHHAEYLLARALRGLRRYDEAISQCQDLVRVEQTQNEACNSCQSHCRTLLAHTFLDSGERSKGIELLREVLADQENHFPTEHSDVAETKISLAAALHSSGLQKEAGKYYTSAIEFLIQQSKRDESRIHLLNFNLAMAYRESGQLGAAAATLDWSLQIQQSCLDANHPSLLQTQQAIKEVQTEYQSLDSSSKEQSLVLGEEW